MKETTKNQKRGTSYAILGLGRFGRKLVQLISKSGANILIADRNREKVNLLADRVTDAVCLDLSTPAAIQELELEHIDIAIVDLSHHLEASIMSIMEAAKNGVEQIIATASTEHEKEILERIGATEVVIPDDYAAVETYKGLYRESFMDLYNLGGDLIIIRTNPKKEWTRKSLRKLALREKEQINIIAVQRDGEMNEIISPDLELREDDVVAIITRQERIFEFVD
jgi:trk system potassium uptake protein TrkA